MQRSDIKTYLKKVFWPNLGVGVGFQILDIPAYACGLKPDPAYTLDQNPFFEIGFSYLGRILAIMMILLSVGSLAGAAALRPLSVSGGHAEKTTSAAADLDAAVANDPSQIEAYMATLSDEQVRRLLITALKKEAALSAAAGDAKDAPGRLKSLIHGIRTRMAMLQARMAELRLGQQLKWEDEPNLFNYLGRDAPHGRAGPAMVHVGVILLLGFAAQWGYWRYAAPMRRRIEAAVPSNWWSALGGLCLRGALDIVGILVLAAVALAAYGLYTHRSGSQTVLLATYLMAIVIVQGVLALLRFILAPGHANLRIFPLDNDLARYLYRWLAAITALASFGFMTCGLFHVAGTSEGLHLTMVFAVALIGALMLVTMILQKRQVVSAALGAHLAVEGLVARLAAHWHHVAIFIVALILFSSLLLSVMGSPLRLPGLKTLTALALFFPVDWIMRRMLGALIHLAGSRDRHGQDGHTHLAVDAAGRATAPAFFDTTRAHRIQHVILTGLRVSLAVLFMVWIFSFWGVALPYARQAARAIFNILIVVCLCYVAWELASAAIQKRLQAEMPDIDEDMEEGGSGGSRLGTLLLLLRKFVLSIILIMASLIILSAMGVNIGPLIAGAGVVGLAIGFGAQTLVKDIISGLFFLLDDAFRVGDYIEVGGTRGTVERISMRSMALRHPRGMVHTLPFGDIANVTNFSRDYIITKLEFRVRYDTDVEKVRKVIKKHVYKPILKNADLAPKLLGKIKSQGVRQLDDSAMIMRVKFKTIPGEQFVIRKEVYRLMKEAFGREGIAFAHRNVTVYMPKEEAAAEAPAHAAAAARAAAVQAGGAAAADEPDDGSGKRSG